MNYSCGNCKYMKYRKEYLYPYTCEKDKAKSYMREEIDRRISIGYKCDKYKSAFDINACDSLPGPSKKEGDS